MPARMISEDFLQYALAGAHVVLLHVGAIAPVKLATAKQSGSFHVRHTEIGSAYGK